MAEQKPSIGRIVHFGRYEGQKLELNAAMIVRVHENGPKNKVDLLAFNASPRADKICSREINVPFSETLEPNCWTWPPRV